MVGTDYTSYTFYQEITGAIMSTTVKPSADAAAIHNTREAVRSQPGLGNPVSYTHLTLPTIA